MKHGEIERPTLGTLAFTCYVFSPLSDYDRSLKEFRDNDPRLSKPCPGR